MSSIRLLFPILAACTAGAVNALGAPVRPNVVLILADDLGYETVGADGGSSYQTPVLDKLATSGMRFTQCYAQPLCTPTRVQLMTGLSNARNYIDFGNMDPKAVTFGNLFQRAGYATCMAGKWQLGRVSELPREFGFDEYCLWWHTFKGSRYANPGLEINGVRKNPRDGEYGPDVINAFVLDFIARHRDKPFFLYYPMVLTHTPYEATPDSADWDPRANEKSAKVSDAYFADMVGYMDKLVGRVVDRLDELGLHDNTLLIFVGDNGTGGNIRSMMGVKIVVAGKGRPLTTGMHVPCLVDWPGRVAPGATCTDLVDTTDFLPTICAAADVSVPTEPTLDGRSFLPQLRGEKGSPREWIYSWFTPRGEKRLFEFAFNQRYKLYRTGEFFDLATDPDELHPLKAASLVGDAVVAARALQVALDRYRDARPARLATPPLVGPGAIHRNGPAED